jgi:xanthine dehydrogenase accessory factor
MLNNDTQGFHPQNWAQAVSELNQSAIDYVLVTVLGSAGSTPRAAGSKMVVTGEQIYDTIGGGHLEFKAIEQARRILTEGDDGQTVEHFPLGASLGQCCGGSVTLLFEPMFSLAMSVDVYGAGHVAHALMTILAGLPVQVRWIDSRAELFPDQVPTNIQIVVDEDPTEQIKFSRPGAANVILTHNHQLDFALVEKLIKQLSNREQAGFIGVIGSNTKAKRFRMRLEHKQFTAQQVALMTCPIGLSNVEGKLPMEVAVSIAAQLMQQYQQKKHQQKKHRSAPARKGVQWQQIKSLLKAEVISQ